MKLIGIEDLPGNLGVKLEDSFRKDFFDRAISKAGSVRKLSIILKCHRDSVRLWKKGKILTKISLLKKLTEFTKNDLTTIESKIVAIRNKRVSRKDFIKIKLPIFSSSELVSLVGQIIGDVKKSKDLLEIINKSNLNNQI
jgi:hypothetical protein